MTSYTYKERLQWINQIQLFRTELTDIRQEVTKNAGSNPVRTSKILEVVSFLNRELDQTDLKILLSLNQEKVIWKEKYNHLHVSKAAPEDDEALFERMKQHFNQVLNFQHSVERYLSELPLPEEYENTNRQRKQVSRNPGSLQREVSFSKNGIL